MLAVPTIPETAPFSAEQRQWLNGFLAGYFSIPAGAVAPPPALLAGAVEARKPLLLLYGSQTGTAEQLARKLGKASGQRGCAPRVVGMEDYAKVDLTKEETVLVITSTYGDGEPPDNARAFWQYLKSEPAPTLAHLQFSVLALGDTNYAGFCQFGKDCDARLEELGARRMHPRQDCDVDYAAPAGAWQEAVFAALTDRPAPIAESTASPAVAEGFTRTNPFPARLLENRLLNEPGSAKEVRHFAISLAGSGLTYEVGDALGVMPANCPERVTELLTLLGCDGEEAVPTADGAETSLRLALAQHYDVSRPSPDFLKAAAPRFPELAALLDPARQEELRKFLWGREVIDVLAGMSAPFGAGEFVTLLKKLRPRLYSISSSPKVHPDEVHLTVGAVRYESHGRRRKGVASTFLADRASAETAVPVFVQVSHGFRLPAQGDTPVIMCGPGTGIAPFRAFLEERAAIGAGGRNWLFFGDQRQATDFLYREQLEGWLAAGHLTRLDLAFSRDQEARVYVQQRMLEQAAALWAWLQEGAHFYVCGDASRMAKDVDAALHAVCATAGGLSPDAATEYVARLKSEKRYQRDVY